MPRGKKAANGADHDDAPPAKQNASPENDAECFTVARELKRQSAQISQKLAAHYARFENLGVDTASIKDCLKLEKERDPPGRLQRLTRMAAILNMIPTETEKDGQINILPGLTVPGLNAAHKEKLAKANAYNDGYNTGLAGGEDTNNRFPVGSELRVLWSQGCIDGQGQRAINRANKPEKKTAGRAATKEPETALEKDEAEYRFPAGTTLSGDIDRLVPGARARLERAGVEVTLPADPA